MQSLTDRALYSFQSIFDQIKLNQMDDQLKEHRIVQLQTLYKLHQISLVTTDQDQEKASRRLQSMVECAIIIEHVAYINNLIQAGAKITDYHLFLAIMANSDKLISKFLDLNLNPNAKFNLGIFSKYFPLELACLRGQKAAKAILALVAHGADLTISTKGSVGPD